MPVDPATLKRKHPDYLHFNREWQFFWQSYEGGQEYIHGGRGTFDFDGEDITPHDGNVGHGTFQKANLIQHKRESDFTYKERIRRAFYLNYCGAIIDTYISHLNKQTPITETTGVSNWDQFTKDVNRSGDSMVEFRHDIQTAACALGHCFILVDKPQERAVSAADEIERGLMPFYTLYYPWDIWDWQLDRFGEPWWVKIVENADTRLSPIDQKIGNRLNVRFKIWTRNAWVSYDEKGKIEAFGEHGLGRVPLVPVYNRKRQRSRFLGISAINDIAYVNRRIFNLGSLIDEFAYRACFPMLTNPITMGDNQDTMEVSETLVWDYPDVARHPPSWLSPPTEPMEFLAGEIETSEQKIYRLARLEAGFEPRSKQPPASGVSKAFDWMETSTILSQKADNFEEAENKAAQFWLDWMDNRRGKIVVEYPDNFDVKTLDKDLQDATELSTLFISETLMGRIFNKLVEKIDPKIPPDERERIRKEIEINVKALFSEHQFASLLTNEAEGSDE